MKEMFEDIDSVEIVVDDILVWGMNEAEHDSRLIKVLDRARLQNLKLNKSKCQFKKQEITYLGHILTKDGLKPDPKKTQTINNMTPPTSKQALQRFLGMLTYLPISDTKLYQLKEETKKGSTTATTLISDCHRVAKDKARYTSKMPTLLELS